MLQTFTLKNGLKVATYSIPEMRSVTVDLNVKAGSIFDTKDNSGTAHFMEHMLVQGIPSYPNVRVFSNYIEGFAGSYGATTYQLMVQYWMNAPKTQLDECLKISSEVFFAPLFPPDALERERQAIKEEIRSRQEGTGYKKSVFWKKKRYKKGHPLLLDTGGTLGSVSKVTRESLMDYWKRFFIPEKTYLVVVGGFSNNEVKKLIQKYFGPIVSTSPITEYPKLTNGDLSNRTVAIRFDKELKTCDVDLNFPSLSDKAPLKDRIAQGMGLNILGGLRNSRLYKLLRQDKGLVYTIGSGHSVSTGFGYVYVSTEVSEQKLDEVLDLIAKEVLSFVKSGVTEEELKFAKNYTINRSLMSWDHPSNIAGWIKGDLMWEDKIQTPEEYAREVDKVTAEDILALIKKHWDFNKLNLIIQGPLAASKKNKEKYAQMFSELK